jgi:hypothetical protein
MPVALFIRISDEEKKKRAARKAAGMPEEEPKKRFSFAEIYQKYKKPGTDTKPHTAMLSPEEEEELGEEIDMGSRKKKK